MRSAGVARLQHGTYRVFSFMCLLVAQLEIELMVAVSRPCMLVSRL